MTGNKGFTLLELMIAILIFTLISTASYKLFDSVSHSKEVTDGVLSSLDELQRGLLIIEKDFLQIAARSIRNELGETEAPVLAPAKNGYLIVFTKTGWRNPLGLVRSDLQRVAYAVEGGALIRYYWPMLDRGPDPRLIRQTLLKNVQSAKIRFMDDSKRWRSSWPPPKNQKPEAASQQGMYQDRQRGHGQDDDADDIEQKHVMPEGVVIAIRHEVYGLLELSFPLMTVKQPKNKGGRDGQNEDRARDNRRMRESWGG